MAIPIRIRMWCHCSLVEMLICIYLVKWSQKVLCKWVECLKFLYSYRISPGALKTVVDGIAELSVNIVEVVHDRLSSNISAGTAGVYLSLEMEDEKHAERLIEFLKSKSLDFRIS